jgi:hypothetical protein
MEARMRVIGFTAIVAALCLAFSTSGSARMSPSVLMFYGGPLRQPVFMLNHNAELLTSHADFWCGRSHVVIQRQLEDRPFVNIAMFWGVDVQDGQLSALKPEEAHQQGRLYVASGNVPAAVVSTDFVRPQADGRPAPRRVPKETSEFKYGEWLTAADVQIAEHLGLPVRQSQFVTSFWGYRPANPQMEPTRR